MKLYVATILSVAEGDIMDYGDRDVAASGRSELRAAMLSWGDSKWVIREYRVAKLPLRQLDAALYNRASWAAEDLRVWDATVHSGRLSLRLRTYQQR